MASEWWIETHYTVEDVAERLHLHVQTVRRYCREGTLWGYKSGDGDETNAWLIPECSITEFMDERAAGTLVKGAYLNGKPMPKPKRVNLHETDERP